MVPYIESSRCRGIFMKNNELDMISAEKWLKTQYLLLFDYTLPEVNIFIMRLALVWQRFVPDQTSLAAPEMDMNTDEVFLAKWGY